MGAALVRCIAKSGEELVLFVLVGVELHHLLVLDLEPEGARSVHQTLLQIVATDHGVLAVLEDSLRDKVFVQLLRFHHFFMPYQVVLALCKVAILNERVLQVLRRRRSLRLLTLRGEPTRTGKLEDAALL